MLKISMFMEAGTLSWIAEYMVKPTVRTADGVHGPYCLWEDRNCDESELIDCGYFPYDKMAGMETLQCLTE